MSTKNGITSIISTPVDADFDKYVYYKLFATAGTIATVNGYDMNLNPGDQLNIKIESISGDNIYLMGSPINIETGKSYDQYNGILLGGSAFLDE